MSLIAKALYEMNSENVRKLNEDELALVACGLLGYFHKNREFQKEFASQVEYQLAWRKEREGGKK